MNITIALILTTGGFFAFGFGLTLIPNPRPPLLMAALILLSVAGVVAGGCVGIKMNLPKNGQRP